MSPGQIREMLLATPFVPFRMVLSDGLLSYDIDDPFRVFVGNRFVLVGQGMDPIERVPERYVRLDPLHITQLIPLTSPPQSSSGNGQPVGG